MKIGRLNIGLKKSSVTVPNRIPDMMKRVIISNDVLLLTMVGLVLSWFSWLYNFSLERQLVYNDAMSHLDISRRVFDNLTPGAAQLGSVWLPLLHVLMLPTIWIDVFWQTGLSAGLVSMTSYVLSVVFTYKLGRQLSLAPLYSLLATILVALNPNLLYLQTTALTEPLFIGLYIMTLYFFVRWVKHHTIQHLIMSGLLVTLATLTRYDGWALFGFTFLGVTAVSWLRTRNVRSVEGMTVLFITIASFGMALWFGWNLAIFGSPLYFATGEFSAKAQQDVLEAAQDLPTKHNLWLSMLTYMYAMFNNLGVISVVLAAVGWIVYVLKKPMDYKVVAFVFSAPLVFNILALYLGHSVIHLPELFGASWFNVRYGLLMLPWVAIGVAYLASLPNILSKSTVTLAALLQLGLFLNSHYVVTLDDGLWGSSQKNVMAVGDWIEATIGPKEGSLVLVSVASHDAILFQSGLNMKRYIHEGTGKYWQRAIENPQDYADFVIMRTHDHLDSVARAMDKVPGFFDDYELIYDDTYADVYALKSVLYSSQVKL